VPRHASCDPHASVPGGRISNPQRAPAPPPDARGRQTVLIVEDQSVQASLLTRLLRDDDLVIEVVENGEAALQRVERRPPDLVLLDVMLPGLNGIEICRRIKRNVATRLTPVILVTGLHGREHHLAGINAGADDFILKPFDRQTLKARVRSLLRLRRYTSELDSAESVIMRLAQTVEARDPYTAGHCERLARYAMALGSELGLTDDELKILRRGGYVHDVGKIGIPDFVLLKQGMLTSQEHAIMQRHPMIGTEICGDLQALASVRPIVRHHHERLDGSGYPDGLRGAEIPLVVQIIAIVDVFDALTTTRPYRRALTVADACEHLQKDASRGLHDRQLIGTLVDLMRQKPAHAKRRTPR
jgi:putative two-component system response regulator